MKRTLLSIILTICLMATMFPMTACAASERETAIVLSDKGVTVDGRAAARDPAAAVYVGADIVYYEEGRGESYGEGTAADAHSAEEAAGHTVVTITEPGTYRVSGTLSAGQLAVDLGEEAAENPDAVVSLILDGVDITCTVAPAVIFYNVWESGDASTATTDIPDRAGANVIIADGSDNSVNGAYVARIYKEGTTKKLHKYDGAFYSKMSMIIDGGSAGSGRLAIAAANEGLDSELHLTINGGNIDITSQDDGINTNEDNISVTEINGGSLTVNGGLGSEGDGIDSNGHLIINGGTVISYANGRSGDGGLDADGDILLNGGTVLAAGSRNDAAGKDSAQVYMELGYAATQAAGTAIRIVDPEGKEILNFAPIKDYQSFTFSSPDLKLDTAYSLFAGDVQQQYTGNAFGMGGMGRPPEGMEPPEGFDPSQMGERPEWPEGFDPSQMGERPEWPEGMEPPEGFDPGQMDRQPGGGGQAAEGPGSAEFIITESIHSFSGISASADASGKLPVSFQVNDNNRISDVAYGTPVTAKYAGVTARRGGEAEIPDSDIQITVTDSPSENYAATCLLSDGADALTGILPTDEGTYVLTIAVLSSNETYTGSSQWTFTIHGEGWTAGWPFTDVAQSDAANWYYSAVKYAYEKGLMTGTAGDKFSPEAETDRAMIVTILWRLAGSPAPSAAADFSDVAADAWYADAVAWAAEKDIVDGYGDGSFGPRDSVTREQLAALLFRYLAPEAVTLEYNLGHFSDEDQISEFAVSAMNWAVGQELISGKDNNKLAPAANASRAETATLLMRFCEKFQ